MRKSILAGLALSVAGGIAFAAETGPDLSQMNPAMMKGLIPGR